MSATAILTVLIVIVALGIAAVLSNVYYEPLDEPDPRVDQHNL
ncbi:MAG: hypothetical protein RI637_03015 [Acidimicrobiia bacterium]|nr:hypothetical protein [Acidimicrobiia bacterium]